MKEILRKLDAFSVMIILIYLVIIVASIVYFIMLQSFGSAGLEFSIEGRDTTFNIFDILVLIALPVAIVLFIISIIAFRRKKSLRIFLISTAFFFFLVNEVLVMIHNFFPHEFIFIENAERALDLLVLLSFIFLMYKK